MDFSVNLTNREKFSIIGNIPDNVHNSLYSKTFLRQGLTL